MIPFKGACLHFRVTDLEGCPYAVCLNNRNYQVDPDVVACQFAMSCQHFQKPDRNEVIQSLPEQVSYLPKAPGFLVR